MRARLLTAIAALLALLTLAAMPALARGRGPRATSRRSAVVLVAPERDFHTYRFEPIRFNRDTRFDSYSDRIGYPQRPPGWSRGRKTGWGRCDLPPGLAKKYGCHQSFILPSRLPRNGAVLRVPLFVVDDR